VKASKLASVLLGLHNDALSIANVITN